MNAHDISGNCPASPPCTYCNSKGYVLVLTGGNSPLVFPEGPVPIVERWLGDMVTVRACPHCSSLEKN